MSNCWNNYDRRRDDDDVRGSRDRNNDLFIRANRVFVAESDDRRRRCCCHNDRNDRNGRRVLNVDDVFIRGDRVFIDDDNDRRNRCRRNRDY